MIELLAGPYAVLIKIGLVIALILGIFGGGYYAGYSHANKTTQAAVTTHVIQQIKQAPKEDAKLVQLFNTVHLKGAQTILEVPSLVQVDSDCDINADVIGVLNSNRSSMSSIPANDGTGAAASTNQ